MSWLMCALALSVSGWAAPKKTLVIVGDSLTEGFGVSREQSFPALLEKKMLSRNWRVVNAGISGSTTASAPSRVKWQLKQKPNIILLALGANDGLRGIDVATIEKNLSEAIMLAQSAKVPIVLAGMKMPPNYGADYTQRFERVFKNVANKHKVPFIPFLLDGVAGAADMNLSDGIHPNEKGHIRLAETVYKGIEKLL